MNLQEDATNAASTKLIHRALPPFDKPHFAEGLLEDIRLIFKQPIHKETQIGLVEGSSGCRYVSAEWTTDVLPNLDDCWQINRYTPGLKLDTSIVATGCDTIAGAILPKEITLQRYGTVGYRLKLKRIDVESEQNQ